MKITKTDEPNLKQTEKPKRKKKTKPKTIVSSKRYVVAVKVFVTPEEKRQLETRALKANCKSLSNLIRQHLGLSLNEIGRRKQLPKDFFSNIEDIEIENLLNDSLG